jgi:alcohol dehydrogenase class IV
MKSNIINFPGALMKLPDILEKYQAKKLFFVTGKTSFINSDHYKNLAKLLTSHLITIHSDFEINPKIDDILRGIEIAEKECPDVIIGIGGGSVLDTAKLIAAFYKSNANLSDVIKNGKDKPNRIVKLILIPTTAGSGSEATHFAVIYFGQEKYSYASFELIPENVILDSTLTESASRNLTAVTAFDALSQAVESFWATGSTEESRAYSSKSIKIILEIFDSLMENPTSKDREQMLSASFYAGNAINISKTTAPHALSYAITMKYGIAHGHAVALTLPQFFLFNSDVNIDKLNSKIGKPEYLQTFNTLLELFGVKSAEEAQNKLLKMMKVAGLETNLSMIGVKSVEDISELCKGVNVERLNNNPMRITQPELNILLSNLL